MELLIEAGLMKADLVKPLWNEANEICVMAVASKRTIKGR